MELSSQHERRHGTWYPMEEEVLFSSPAWALTCVYALSRSIYPLTYTMLTHTFTDHQHSPGACFFFPVYPRWLLTFSIFGHSHKRRIMLRKLVSALSFHDPRSRGSKICRVAVKHMASSLAVEWAKKNVRVNVLRCDSHTSEVCYSWSSFCRQPRLHVNQAHENYSGTWSGIKGLFWC